MTTSQDTMTPIDAAFQDARPIEATQQEGFTMLPEEMKVIVDISFLGVKLTLKQVNATYHALTSLQIANEVVKSDPNVDLVALGFPDILDRLNQMTDALIESDLINESLFPDERYLTGGDSEFDGDSLPGGQVKLSSVKDKRPANVVSMSGRAVQELSSGLDQTNNPREEVLGGLHGKSYKVGEKVMEVDHSRLMKPIPKASSESADGGGFVDLSNFRVDDYVKLINQQSHAPTLAQFILLQLLMNPNKNWSAKNYVLDENHWREYEELLKCMVAHGIIISDDARNTPPLAKSYYIEPRFYVYYREKSNRRPEQPRAEVKDNTPLNVELDDKGFFDMSSFSMADFVKIMELSFTQSPPAQQVLRILSQRGNSNWCPREMNIEPAIEDRVINMLRQMESFGVLERTTLADTPTLVKNYRLTKAFVECYNATSVHQVPM